MSRRAGRARVFAVFALGYFVSYLFRGVNLVLAPHLARDIGIDAAGLGLLTSAYLLGFAGFQLPLGMLLDRYGPRRIEATLLVVAALGAILFGTAQDLAGLLIGRALIGLGVSACLVASTKAVALWFPAERIPFLSNAIFALGGLGGAAAGTPVELALRIVDWRGLFLALAAVTLGVAGLLALAVPEHGGGRPAEGLGEQWRGILFVLGRRAFWGIALLSGLSNGVFLAVQGLWAGPFMRQVEGLGTEDAAGLIVVIALAMVAGGFVLGWLTPRLHRHGVPFQTTAGWAMTAFMVVQAAMLLNPPGPPAVLWAFYGFFGSAGLLGYALLAQVFPPQLIGRAGTAGTLVTFGFAFLFQAGFGTIVTAWPGGAAAGHRAAWMLALAAQLLALLLYCRTRLPAAPRPR